MKRILIAGDKEIITTNELKNIISKLPKIIIPIFDLYFAKNNNTISDNDRARIYLTDTRDIYDTIEFNQENFDLISIDQILKLAQNFIPDTDLKKFKPSFVALKKRLIGGNAETFSLTDIKKMLDFGNDFSERTYFNTVTYNYYQSDLEKNVSLTSLKQLDLPVQYFPFSAKRISELHNEFQDIAVNLRYFRSKNEGISYYGNGFARNKYGFLEAANLKWMVQKLVNGYGHKNNNGIQQVSVLEFQAFLFDIRPILEEYKLWSPNPESFARNAILLADLFQNKSNGDCESNVYEATEYLQMILTASKITANFKEDLTSLCNGGVSKEDPVFETACFNEHFFDTMLRRYNKFFPRLVDYVNPKNTSKKDVNDYLNGIEGFARDNPNPSLPINKRDNILIIGALLNIESFFVRFDLNQDNIIDYNELLSAFKVYKPAIILLTHLKPADEGYAQSIFFYMVSKMEIPPTGSWLQSAKFYSFHKCISIDICRNTVMDKIEGKRLNIGKLLYYMVNQTPKNLNKDKKLQ